MLNNNAPTYRAYDGWNLIGELGTTAWINLFFNGAGTDEILGRWNCVTNYWAWFHYDVRGCVSHITGADGALLEQYAYDAFGTPYIYDGSGNSRSASAYGNRFLFSGREWLAEVGLYDFRRRVLHPAIGRFLQVDPMRFGANDENLYRYCNNDPINFRDPFGLDYTQAEIDQSRQMATSGLALRELQMNLVAMGAAPFAVGLQATRSVVGTAGSVTGINAIVDEFETSSAGKWGISVVALVDVAAFFTGFNNERFYLADSIIPGISSRTPMRDRLLLEFFAMEHVRQSMLLRFVNSQTASDPRGPNSNGGIIIPPQPPAPAPPAPTWDDHGGGGTVVGGGGNVPNKGGEKEDEQE